MSEQVGDITVGAIIAANSIGSPYLPGTDCPWAWPFEKNDEFGGKHPPQDYKLQDALDTKLTFVKSAGQSTVIGAIATNAVSYTHLTLPTKA